MDNSVLAKLIGFWLMFYISPGPVWVAVMEATRNQTWMETLRFFIRTFLKANLLVQVPQAIICVVFIGWLTSFISDIEVWFYLVGGSYMLYLAYRVLKAKQVQTSFVLTFTSLTIILLSSPKIWTLFPTGAVMANQFSNQLIMNVLVFGGLMLLVSNACFFLYAWLSKLGTKVLKDNFSYLAFALLVMFAVFLFREVWLLL